MIHDPFNQPTPRRPNKHIDRWVQTINRKYLEEIDMDFETVCEFYGMTTERYRKMIEFIRRYGDDALDLSYD